MGMSDVLKVFVIARAVGENNLKTFQNITHTHKSRNVRAVHAINCLLYSQQNRFLMLLFTYIKHITRSAFQRFGKCLSVFFELIIYNNCD